ncbi:MAG: ubiquinol-cytochrome c reductase iron-sulfur subunit [Rhodobacterales bacterium CG_4_10_14_0_8_um_filter_70_9]|nr:MAG: ubiquinol-cytochrome c reductase iron-sulfur subunit [Rhodobacterales bacterium CG_4_10_14_0_8_um_filter_70_9]PJA59110.1 MAG: ubiquinol-cytochrome c reductase iron-sulfur subunit [Rhodobacterales bacterium CG_4_9_14_3_um_filter_71_31]
MSSTTHEEGTRRDFLYVATGAVGAVTVGAAVWPLIDQMNPSASVLALATIDIDLSALSEGQQITVKWRGKPVFVRYRTEAEIEAARATPLSDLADPLSRSGNAPTASADDANRALGENGEYLVMVGVCTHLGCVPLGQQGEFNGWFCPCHGSHYDTSGRIRKGPAPRNLHIPELAFDGTTVTLIEEYKA